MSSKRSRGATLLQAAGGVLPSAPSPASPHKRLAVEGVPAAHLGGGGVGGGAQCSPRSRPVCGAAVEQREQGHGGQAREEAAEDEGAATSQPRALPLDLHRLLHVFGGWAVADVGGWGACGQS